MSAAPAARPCGSCPYRRDVPSGVWAAGEYERLPAYDYPTPFQPPALFFCHQQNGKLCAGWVGCHDMYESLALRLQASMGSILTDEDIEAALSYESPVPLFDTGLEAAQHGLANVQAPDANAQRIIDRLVRKRTRRQTQ